MVLQWKTINRSSWTRTVGKTQLLWITIYFNKLYLRLGSSQIRLNIRCHALHLNTTLAILPISLYSNYSSMQIWIKYAKGTLSNPLSNVKCQKVLAGHASGCWHSALPESVVGNPHTPPSPPLVQESNQLS